MRSKVLTFSELMKEWQANIKANLSISYYLLAQEVGRKVNAFLVEQHLDDKPISVITVRDVQMFLNSFAQKGYQTIPTVKVKKDFPKTVNFRELAREHIITRCSSYGMRRKGYYLAVNIYRLPIFPHSVGHYLKRYEREWKMKEVTCHGLRHTYCSLLLSQNVPIQTVSKYMGHSDSTVTLKVYSHFIPDTQATALSALNNITA